MATGVVGWENDTPLERPPPPYQRSFPRRVFFVEGDTHSYAFVHYNELIMCGVPHLHPLLRRAKRGSISVDFGACSDTQVAGKSKSGAQRLKQASKMATVTCTLEDTEETCSFHVPCPVGGQLIEINSRLLEEPDILLDAPYEEGFLAILYVKAPQREKALAKGIEGDEAYAAAVNGT